MFSWIRSAHSWKLGAEVRRVWSNSRNRSNFIPNYTFANILDFADDEPLQVFRGPGYAQVDLSASKKFAFTERVSAQLRIEAFNAFNRVNLNNPVLDLNNNNFGRSVSALTPRVFQAGLRVQF